MYRLQKLTNQINPNSSNSGYPWVLTIPPYHDFQKIGNVKSLTVVISGASRGIGLAIGKRLGRDGANIVILAKTESPHPKLPGTIDSACKEIQEVGGNALGIRCDIRYENEVKSAIEKVIEIFGGIDILVNNASAIHMTDTQETDMKKFDLMSQVNSRGAFMLSKYCVPHLKKSRNPHILNISPPLNMVQARWFQNHCAYSMAKFGMSLCVLGMSAEFKDDNIAVNALWPRTSISTSAVKFIAGHEAMNSSRNDDIMADSAYIILTSNSKFTTGNFFIDDEVLVNTGVRNFDKYKSNPSLKDCELRPDIFV